MEDLKQAFIKLCVMQCDKLRIETGDLDLATLEGLDRLTTRLNDHDRDALDFACRMLRFTQPALRFASHDGLIDVCAELLDAPREILIVSGPTIVVNLPSKKIRLYTWHCEKYWYPKRRNFVNLWMPAFRTKKPGNGTMAVLPKSHKGDWSYFTEYFGFDAATQGNTAHNLQYEVPASEIQGYEPHHIQADSGDLVVFHPNTVHCSTVNESDSPSYLISIRIFDYRKDLTLSSEWTDSPYRIADTSKPGGRCNLLPARLPMLHDLGSGVGFGIDSRIVHDRNGEITEEIRAFIRQRIAWFFGPYDFDADMPIRVDLSVWNPIFDESLIASAVRIARSHGRSVSIEGAVPGTEPLGIRVAGHAPPFVLMSPQQARWNSQLNLAKLKRVKIFRALCRKFSQLHAMPLEEVLEFCGSEEGVELILSFG